MYVIYGQKGKGDPQPFPINSQISFLSDLFKNQCWIFAAPGYMSRDEKAKEYIERFDELIRCFSGHEADTQKQYIAFGNGYNTSVEDEYTTVIDKGTYALKTYKVDLPQTRRNNHSKMIFYFFWENAELKDKYAGGDLVLSRATAKEFLNGITVKAIIVGSSNQSYTTFFNNSADKGEADVLLLPSRSKPGEVIEDEEAFIRDIKWEHGSKDLNHVFVENHMAFFESNIISKSLFLVKDCDTEEEYFKAIFRKCLIGELK